MRFDLTFTTALVSLAAVLASPVMAGPITVTGTGTQGSPLNFGNALVGATGTTTKTVTVTNPSSPSRTVNASTGSADYSVTPTSATIQGNQGATTRDFVFSFAPKVTGTRTLSGSLTSAAAGHDPAVNATVYGTGLGVAPAANLTTVTNAGNTLVGGSKTGSVSVSNTGNGNLAGADPGGAFNAATSTNLRLTALGSSNASFSVPNAPASLTDSNAQSFDVTFAPTTKGAAATTITGTFANGIGNTNSNGTRTTTVTGTGVAPLADVTTINAGYVLVGGSKTGSITVSNSGNGNLAGADPGGAFNAATSTNLRLTGLNSNNAAFSVPNGSSSLVDSGQQAFNVTFAPATRGAANATITAAFANGIGASNAGGSLTGNVAGTGVAPIANLSTGSNAGYVLVGGAGSVSLNVSNTGNGNLAGADPGGSFSAATSTNLRLSNLTSSNAAFTPITTSASLADAGSTNIVASFAPTARGAADTTFTGTFFNGTNAANAGGNLTTSGQGTGVAPVIGSVSSSSAGNTRIGTVGTGTISVGNTGDGNKAGANTASYGSPGGFASNLLGRATVAGPTFAITGPDFSVGDNGTGVAGYSFAATARGAQSVQATLDFKNGKADGTNLAFQTSATLSGTGVGPQFSSNFGSAADAGSNNTIDFGTIDVGKTGHVTLALSNITPDMDLGDPTALSIFDTSGLLGSTVFSLAPFATTVLHPGGSLDLDLSMFSTKSGKFTDTLIIRTDQDGAFGSMGDLFSFDLAGEVRDVPEPSAVLLLGAGLVGLFAARRRMA